LPWHSDSLVKVAGWRCAQGMVRKQKMRGSDPGSVTLKGPRLKDDWPRAVQPAQVAALVGTVDAAGKAMGQKLLPA